MLDNGTREQAFLQPPETLCSDHYLVSNDTHQGKYVEADPLFLRAIEIVEKTLGPHHPRLATVINGQATCFMAQVRFRREYSG